MNAMLTVDPVTLDAWLKNDEAVLIDVREPDEFASAHIPRAMSVPLAKVTATLEGFATKQGRKLVFQCQKGGRAGQACALMESRLGEIYNLSGGIEAWSQAGLPVIGEAAPNAAQSPLPLMRQVQIVVGALILLSVFLGFTQATAFFALAGFFGAGLLFAGITGWCGMALLLARMPWNR